MAYERLCVSTSTDDLTVELLRVTAAHMCKCQINMSADLIFAKENRQIERQFKAKRADNIAAERFSATWDNYKRRFARNENDLRTNGRVCWILNDVAEWLCSKPLAEQDRLIRLVLSVQFRATVMQRHNEHKAAEKEAWQERTDKAIANGKRLDSKSSTVLHNQDMWEQNTVEQRLEHLKLKGQKTKLLKAQYIHVEAWYKQAGKTFPFSKQPGDTKFDTWFGAFQVLHCDKEYAKVMAYKAEHENDRDGSRVIQNLEQEKGTVELTDQETLAEWSAAIIAEANSSVHRSTKHRAEARELEQQEHAEKNRFGGYIQDDSEGVGAQGNSPEGRMAAEEAEGGAAMQNRRDEDASDMEMSDSDASSVVSMGEMSEDQDDCEDYGEMPEQEEEEMEDMDSDEGEQ